MNIRHIQILLKAEVDLEDGSFSMKAVNKALVNILGIRFYLT